MDAHPWALQRSRHGLMRNEGRGGRGGELYPAPLSLIQSLSIPLMLITTLLLAAIPAIAAFVSYFSG